MTVPAEQLVSLVAPTSMEADQYRGLRHTVERMRHDSNLQVLAVTSPGAGDGKTVTTLNLAGSLAQGGSARVLVIDADLHRPSVAKYLGMDGTDGPGLAELMSREDRTLADTVRRLDNGNLSVLPSGVCDGGVYELLSSARATAIVEEARRSFDFVLIYTPPLMPLPDCRLISQWVDGVIVVVTAHRTPRKALAEALSLLDPDKLLGLVFNGDDRPLTPYASYYSYYGDQTRRPEKGFGWRKRRPASERHASAGTNR